MCTNCSLVLGGGEGIQHVKVSFYFDCLLKVSWNVTLTHRGCVREQISVTHSDIGSCGVRAGFLGKCLKICVVKLSPGKHSREEFRGRSVKLQGSVYVFCAHGSRRGRAWEGGVPVALIRGKPRCHVSLVCISRITRMKEARAPALRGFPLQRHR